MASACQCERAGGHHRAHTPIPTGPDPAAEIIKEMGRAEVAIEKKFNALNGKPGPATGPIDLSGLIGVPGGGFFRAFRRGRIFYNSAIRDEAFFVGRADELYGRLGGPGGRLGWPVSDDGSVRNSMLFTP